MTTRPGPLLTCLIGVIAACSAACLRGAPAEPAPTASSTIAAPASPSPSRRIICDVKRALAGLRDSESQPILDPDNYRNVLRALREQLGCDAIRIGIDPDLDEPGQYSALYSDVVKAARSLGLTVYANPLFRPAEGACGKGSFCKAPAPYASWIAAYANAFRPEWLGPFNESGLAPAALRDIAKRVRDQLRYAPSVVGPDVQRVQTALSNATALAGVFDIYTSHDADLDDSATLANWRALRQATGGAVWASENPRPWNAASGAGDEVGVAAAIEGGVDGIVLYEAFPVDVALDGSLTAKGAAIAAGLHRAWGRP